MNREPTQHHRPIDTTPVEMKPCPFCGGRYAYIYCGRQYHIDCFACGAEGPHTLGGPISAVEKWNIRHE